MQRLLTRAVRSALVLSLIAASAAAQGSDGCATPTSISGTGSFAFDTTPATTGTEGQSNAICNFSGSIAIRRDVWFAWVAPATDSMTLTLCGTATFDTKVAVYQAAACPGAAAIACNDDSCGLQSTVQFNATAGTSYLIQLGGFNTSSAGSGTFSLDTTGSVPGCGPNTGPDVIVGDLNGILNFSDGSFRAVSIGTDSCNIGTQTLSWVGGTNAHPVIRQNVYRYKVVSGSGRFEHVGMSWCKNGFTALQQNLCCPCTSSGTGSALGVGCSDPYSASLNSNQTNAEPNYMINAHTGVFTYPPANPPISGATKRRCEMAAADVEATGTGVRYFGEGQYVTADDSAAGNQNNNASYREMTCNGSTFSLIGATQREMQAIRAWATVESGVTLTDVQIPGEGLLVVGSKATSLGAGQWHYEFAVYNMNSDRNVGSVSVPVPAGATVTNIGFHDVAYHSGDGNGGTDFTGTDWVGTHAGGAVTWACQTQAANNNANAIRWGTLYNFRFDANVAPTNGVVSLGLWKTGSPASVTGAGQVPGNSAFSGFCAGDGTVAACPCGNNGSSGHGCANSSFAGGASLTGSGSASVAADTTVISSSSMTGATCVFFQGDAQQPPVVVDDGLGCVTGSVVRLGTKSVTGNASSYPQAGDTSIAIRGAIPGAGGTRYYQCFYRNAAAAFCPPATSNRTNGVAITWAP